MLAEIRGSETQHQLSITDTVTKATHKWNTYFLPWLQQLVARESVYIAALWIEYSVNIDLTSLTVDIAVATKQWK